MGRHSAVPVRRLRRLPVLLAAAVLLVAGISWGAVVLVRARTGCAEPVTLRVVAAEETAPVLTRIASALPPGTGPGCGTVEVQSRDSLRVVEDLALPQTGAPHVWVPESTLMLRRAREAGADIPTSGRSIAGSPVVLALDEQTASTLGWPDKTLTWSDVLGSADTALRVGMPDPARDPVGVSALFAARDTVKDKPDPGAAFAELLRRLSPNMVAGAPELFNRLPSADARETLTAFPTTENSLLRHNVEQGGRGLVAVYAPLAPALDHPFAVLLGAGEAERAAADRFLHAVEAPEGVQAFADAGFRAPGGQALRDRSQDGRVVSRDLQPATMPPADEVDLILNQWAGINLSSRLQVLIDVSGSMNAVEPVSGRTRMELTREAAQRALRLFRPTSDIRILTFATKLDGDKDYREVLPMAPVSEQLARGAEATLGAIQATPDGQTGLYDSVLDAYRTARAEWEPGRLNLVVVMTDGRNEDSHGISREELLTQLGGLADPKRPIQLIGIGVGPDIDVAELQEITAATGGQAFTTPDPGQINEVFYAALSKLACCN
ncbi:substrate-binding and VWA domain-containing protein [Amycolatopsis sp. YIM 10]|uniref:substrate-binding and VWA domain-containing protein n=1 Tax=Amycolatopsis sp. YIM 10 TaxID=2653857 RepID=UPI0012901E4F|nr:substrate-binding and VWA domain-containing protein [Amycolatopsis sp. YIM 10]QFU92322.1 von Willebrand factor type A domain protein [Amycolatopsis sp. YIM 10]